MQHIAGNIIEIVKPTKKIKSFLLLFFKKEVLSDLLSASYRLTGKKFPCAARTLSVMKSETTATRAWLFMSE